MCSVGRTYTLAGRRMILTPVTDGQAYTQAAYRQGETVVAQPKINGSVVEIVRPFLIMSSVEYW